jgi:hypothetical protein
VHRSADPAAPTSPRPPRVRHWLAAAGLMSLVALWPARPEPDPPVLFDLLRDLPKATASVRQGGRDLPCPWSAADRRFVCGSDYWTFIGPYGGTSAGYARTCVWMHPTAAASPSVVQWPSQALGDRLSLQLGLVDDAPAAAVVEAQVWAGDERLASVQASDSRSLATVDLRLPAGPRRAPLRLEVRASDHALRMACVDLTMTGTRRAAAEERR